MKRGANTRPASECQTETAPDPSNDNVVAASIISRNEGFNHSESARTEISLAELCESKPFPISCPCRALAASVLPRLLLELKLLARKGCDYVDLSLVDGWTLPVKFEASGDCSQAAASRRTR